MRATLRNEIMRRGQAHEHRRPEDDGGEARRDDQLQVDAWPSAAASRSAMSAAQAKPTTAAIEACSPRIR